ncbi:hypothetical protein, partial [Globicatella sp. HMSC072A10]|uniref:hypothetical protein n=1 Tax=Globicatella sp. HMSC072A10 TaxID=1739315 RepID=UPI000A0366BF
LYIKIVLVISTPTLKIIEPLILSIAQNALQDNFNEILTYLQIEEQAALKSVNPESNTQEDSSLVSKDKELEEQGFNDTQIYDELSKVYDGVQYVINNDGSIVFQIFGIDTTEKDKVLRVRYKKADIIEAQLKDDKLVFDNIEYSLE